MSGEEVDAEEVRVAKLRGLIQRYETRVDGKLGLLEGAIDKLEQAVKMLGESGDAAPAPEAYTGPGAKYFQACDSRKIRRSHDKKAISVADANFGGGSFLAKSLLQSLCPDILDMLHKCGVSAGDAARCRGKSCLTNVWIGVNAEDDTNEAYFRSIKPSIRDAKSKVLVVSLSYISFSLSLTALLPFLTLLSISLCSVTTGIQRRLSIMTVVLLRYGCPLAA
jgi:hypothetical protein